MPTSRPAPPPSSLRSSAKSARQPRSSRRTRRRRGPGSTPTAPRATTSSTGPTSLPANDTVTPTGQSTYTWTTTSTDSAAVQVPGSSQPRRRRLVLRHQLHRRRQPHRRPGPRPGAVLPRLGQQGPRRAGADQRRRHRARCSTPRRSRRSPAACTWTGRSRATCSSRSPGRPGTNAVLNGLFLDPTSSPPPAATASFLKQDATTQGTWVNTYGAQGYDIVGGPTSLPGQRHRHARAASHLHLDHDLHRPPRPAGPRLVGNRVAAVWYSADQLHRQRQPRRRPVPRPGAVLPRLGQQGPRRAGADQRRRARARCWTPRPLSSFSSGVYLDWKVSGNLLITITQTAGTNAVLNGLFFDQASASLSVLGGPASVQPAGVPTPAASSGIAPAADRGLARCGG